MYFCLKLHSESDHIAIVMAWFMYFQEGPDIEVPWYKYGVVNKRSNTPQFAMAFSTFFNSLFKNEEIENLVLP